MFTSDRTVHDGSAAGSPETNSRGGTRLGSLDFTLNGTPGVKSTGLWVGHDQHDMRDPSEAKVGLGDALGCTHGGGGGPARRRTSSCAVLA
jgi:hypothetical protein